MSASGPFPFASLFLAVPTPFSEDGSFDAAALDHLVNYALAQAPTGIGLLTEAAEDALLLPEERRAILQRVGARARGRTEVIVAISAPCTREAVELVRFAEDQGATAFILSTPGVPGMGYRELYRHTELVSRATERPVLLGVRPGNAAFRLAPEEQATLVQHPELKGAFVPQSSPATLKPWARRFKGRSMALLSGCALTLGDDAEHGGATGAVCGLSLLAPTAGRSAVRAVAEDDAKMLRTLVQAAAPAVSLLAPPRPAEQLDGIHKLATRLAQRPLENAWRPSYPFGLLKAGLKLLGHPVGSRVRPPYEAPSEDRVERLRSALRQSGFLT